MLDYGFFWETVVQDAYNNLCSVFGLEQERVTYEDSPIYEDGANIVEDFDRYLNDYTKGAPVDALRIRRLFRSCAFCKNTLFVVVGGCKYVQVDLSSMYDVLQEITKTCPTITYTTVLNLCKYLVSCNFDAQASSKEPLGAEEVKSLRALFKNKPGSVLSTCAIRYLSTSKYHYVALACRYLLTHVSITLDWHIPGSVSGSTDDSSVVSLAEKVYRKYGMQEVLTIAYIAASCMPTSGDPRVNYEAALQTLLSDKCN